MIEKISHRDEVDVTIKFSSELLLDTEVLLTKERIRKWSIGNDAAFQKIQEISDRTFQRLGLNNNQKNKIIQFEYLVEESAIALCMVEKSEIEFELYPRNEDGLIDFLFRSDGKGFLQRSKLLGGRKFKTWQTAGIEYADNN